MLTCPHCHAALPEGMRFCLQCGASLLAPTARPLARAPVAIAAEPAAAPQSPARPSFDSVTLDRENRNGEIDEEALWRAFARPVKPGAVVCRFCKRPIDLLGEFCDYCGAPVAEAAPAGTLQPPAPAPVPPPQPPAQATPPEPPPASSSLDSHTPPAAEPPGDFGSRLKRIFRK
jgi:hypothetical protein